MKMPGQPLPTLGEELKSRREERGKTLFAISESTRIGTRFLKAIEENRFSVLPGGIFTRSFIRAYAREVGMDEVEAIARFVQESSPDEAMEGLPHTTGPLVKPDSAEQEQAGIKEVAVPPNVGKSFASTINWPTVAMVVGMLLVIVVIVLLVTQRMGKEEAGTP